MTTEMVDSEDYSKYIKVTMSIHDPRSRKNLEVSDYAKSLSDVVTTVENVKASTVELFNSKTLAEFAPSQ